MSNHLSKPCPAWAEQLTQASRSGEASAALETHLAVCPVCAAARADYLYAAALLRQAPVPKPLPGLPPQVLQMWATEAQHTPARHLDHVGRPQEVVMQTIHDQTSPTLPPTPPFWWKRASSRAAAGLSAIAAVLVIALVITALIASHAPGKPLQSGTQPTAPGGSSQWKALPHLANLSDETTLAPSDPRVVYQVAINSQGNQISLRRSDDQGATWKSLPAPSGATLTPLTQLFVSPSNAHHVLVINGINCLTGQAPGAGPLSILSSGDTCSVPYFSSNGGESWAPVTLPAHTSHNLFLSAPIAAQENRLYAMLVVEPGITASELLESNDDGATWQFADQGLDAEQHCLVSVAAPRTGTTLFATTLSHCGGQTSGSEAAQLWRSNDAGMHWASVSALPATAAYSLEAVNMNGQAQPVLIRSGAHEDSRALDFSLDSGKTWQPVPTLSDQGPAQGLVGMQGMLDDGSIVAQSNTGFYAWKAGAASWHKVAPALAGTVIESLAVPGAGGPATLYLEVRPDRADTFNFYSITIA